jgi:hypothetical protein
MVDQWRYMKTRQLYILSVLARLECAIVKIVSFSMSGRLEYTSLSKSSVSACLEGWNIRHCQNRQFQHGWKAGIYVIVKIVSFSMARMCHGHNYLSSVCNVHWSTKVVC